MLTITDNQLKYVKNDINQVALSDELKELWWNWIDSKGFNTIMNSRKNLFDFVVYLIRTSITIMSEYIFEVEDLTWENYCQIMQNIQRMKERNEITNSFFLSKILREIMADFYLFASEYSKSKVVRVYLRKYHYLFLSVEVQKNETSAIYIDDFIEECVRTHFPLYSKPEQIVAIPYTTRTNKTFQANIFIPTEELKLFNLIKEFLLYLAENGEDTRLNHLKYRLFFTHFPKSIEVVDSANIYDSFNETTFKKQFNYFDKLREKHQIDSVQSYFNILLVKFYRFIDDKHFQETGERLFTSPTFNRNVIFNNKYFKYLNEGYEFIIRNQLEDVPKSNKWLLMPNKATKTSHLNGHTNSTLDFNEVKSEELREEVKRYLWFTKNTDLTIKSKSYTLFQFLNFAYENYVESKKVTQIKGEQQNNYFTNDFILAYRATIELEVSNNGSLHNYLNNVRGFLRFSKERFGVNEVAIRLLAERNRQRDGGNPITPSDFRKIAEVFANQNETLADKLCFIVFTLASQTKLRLGEILCLERDCITSLQPDGESGTLKYISKTSNGLKIKDTFLIEDILMIQEAIDLTNHIFEKAPDKQKKFIFLNLSEMYKNKVIRLNATFLKRFSKITKELYEQGELEHRYRPYNTRHTFIDKAWQSVEDNIINSLEISIITGNTARTAVMHYRKYNSIRYVEATHMIDIGDVNVDGEVLWREEDKESLQEVENGAGSCSSSECIKVNETDSDLMCLTCKKFITSLERKPLFEQRLTEYTSLRDAAQSNTEKEYFNSLAELYGAYVAQMYEMLEDEKNE